MRQSGRRDLKIFEAGAPNWWDPAGPMAGLHMLNPLRSEYFRERLESARVQRVLELGCGGGILTSSLEDGPWMLLAQDLLPGPLAAARPHLRRARLVRCDAARLPFRTRSFDAVLSSDFLEHATELRAVVAESARVLRPGGLFLYETFNRTLLSLIVGKILLEWGFRYVPVGTHRFRDFIRPEELHALMDEYGIRNLETFGVIPERGVLRSLITRSAHPFRLDPARLAGIYLGCGRLETPGSSQDSACRRYGRDTAPGPPFRLAILSSSSRFATSSPAVKGFTSRSMRRMRPSMPI